MLCDEIAVQMRACCTYLTVYVCVCVYMYMCVYVCMCTCGRYSQVAVGAIQGAVWNSIILGALFIVFIAFFARGS